MAKDNVHGGSADPRQIISAAAARGRRMLTEVESKKLISAYSAPVVDEWLCADADQALARAGEAGWPVVLKLVSPQVAHKKERGLVAVGIADAEALTRAAKAMLKAAEDVEVDGLLVQRMIGGERELLAGMRRDPTFGPCVTLGLGGIFTEAMDDVEVRVAPLTPHDALQMLQDLKSAPMFGDYRGLKAVDTKILSELLIGLGELALAHPEVEEIDINPLIVDDKGKPVAVDALVVLGSGGAS